MATQWDDFSQPSHHRNKALVVEEKKFWISPSALAELSPVFAALFFSDFKEKEQEEILLPNKNSDDILELLRCLIPTGSILKPVDKENVELLGHLADEYQMVYLKRRCIEFMENAARENDPYLVTIFIESAKYNFKDVVRRILPLFARLDLPVIQAVLDSMRHEIRTAVFYQIIGQKNRHEHKYLASTSQGRGRNFSGLYQDPSRVTTVFTCGNCNLPTILDKDNVTQKYCRCVDQQAAAELEKIGL